MDRKAYHRDFVVEHTDVHTWQDNAENADRAIVTDLLGYGIAAGLTLTEQSSPNLTLQLAAGVAYDALGRRINVPANVTVNLGTDTDGNTTGVASGQERFVAVYLRFKRTAEDPSTAPDATTVYTTQRETYEVLRVAGASGGQVMRSVIRLRTRTLPWALGHAPHSLATIGFRRQNPSASSRLVRDMARND
jgi:hypothetical protein